MAVIRPFRAVVPSCTDGPDISDRTAPPYDVIGPEQRHSLLERSPHNVVALELPEGALDPTVPGNRYETGAERWRSWIDEGVLAQEEEAAFYVLEQGFELDGRHVRRRAVFAQVGLEPFDAGVVIPHERTLPKALGDRLELLRSTAANLSAVFSLFSDPDKVTDGFFERTMASDPTFVATDDDGITSRIWTQSDPEEIAALSDSLREESLYIADGHHRYTTALAYRDELAERLGDEAPEASGYVMMALANMDDPDLLVLPTHRVADAAGRLDPAAFRCDLEDHFDLTDPGDDAEHVLDGSNRPSFVIKTPADGVTVLATLREDVDPTEAVPGEHSDSWKQLDVALLQELVLSPLLDIHPDRPQTLERLSFVKDAGRALAIDDHDVVFLLRPTGLDQLRDVASAGEIMPQKSTYFYPKLPSGMLMRRADD